MKRFVYEPGFELCLFLSGYLQKERSRVLRLKAWVIAAVKDSRTSDPAICRTALQGWREIKIIAV